MTRRGARTTAGGISAKGQGEAERETCVDARAGGIYGGEVGVGEIRANIVCASEKTITDRTLSSTALPALAALRCGDGIS